MSTEYSTVTAEVVNNDQEAGSEQPNDTFGVVALKEGYGDINILSVSPIPNVDLNFYISTLVASHYGELSYNIISIIDEKRETSYVKNLRSLKTVRVTNLDGIESLFVFDVEACI